MSNKQKSSNILTIVVILLVAIGTVYAFWPKPTFVDIGTVTRGHMMLSINEEARTRVRDIYTVSAPVSGRLLRVEIEPNDSVVKNQTIVATMLPSNPAALNAREQQQALTAVQAAEAALTASKAIFKKSLANHQFASKNFVRAKESIEKGTISQSDYDKAQWEADSAAADLENTKAEISLRRAELANAKAVLIDVENITPNNSKPLKIKAPINGRILHILQKSEVFLTEGTPILELGNTDNDLEVIVELLSTDAVKITEGDKVYIKNWGKSQKLTGVVELIEPYGYTKYSALGVEEQRVKAIIKLNKAERKSAGLGHGFRVEVQIIIWEQNNTLIVPSSALFRNNNQWAVFVVDNDSLILQAVKIAQNNGIQANVIQGLSIDTRVVLYPASELEAGTLVADRKESK